MLHLITVVGRSAKNFYLEQQYASDFKSLMRTITSGRMMIVSTKFRSDLFYYADKPTNDSILKLWAFYVNTSLSSNDKKEIAILTGDENSLTKYFHSINKLSTHWHHYMLYKKAVHYSRNNDLQNPVTKTILQCDQYLIEHTSIKRTPLICPSQKIDSEFTQDAFSLAMRIINNETHCN